MTDWGIIWEYRVEILHGAMLTLQIWVVSVVCAFLLACVVVYRLSEGGILAFALRISINCMRALPFLILVYLFYYGLPQVGIKLSALVSGYIAMIVYHAAYFAEILRGSQMVLSKGHQEAALAHGLRPLHAFARIVLPQLIIKTRPILGNQLIVALKDTAFLSIVTVSELTASANAMASQYFVSTQSFVVVIAIYWVLTIMVELGIRKSGEYGAKRGFDNG